MKQLIALGATMVVFAGMAQAQSLPPAYAIQSYAVSASGFNQPAGNLEFADADLSTMPYYQFALGSNANLVRAEFDSAYCPDGTKAGVEVFVAASSLPSQGFLTFTLTDNSVVQYPASSIIAFPNTFVAPTLTGSRMDTGAPLTDTNVTLDWYGFSLEVVDPGYIGVTAIGFDSMDGVKLMSDPVVSTYAVDCDPVNPEPPTVPTSELQSLAAINTYRFTREHVAARLNATQQQTGTYLQQFAGDPRDGSGARWTTLNIAQVGGNGADGLFAATTAAWDLSEGDSSLFGILVGAEYGDYSAGPDGVQKLGVSAGLYGGAKLGGSALVEGHLTYTYFQNEISSGTNSVSVPSQRLLAHVSVSAGLGEAGGLAINPYLEADYAQERIAAYSVGGTAFASETVTTGLASLGIEITTPWNADYGQFYAKLQADQAFGGDVALTNDEVTGTVGLGWFSNTSFDSIGRLEISASGLGGQGAQETRVEGHWERNF